MRGGVLLPATAALGVMLTGEARACIEGSGRQFLFTGTAAEVPAPLVAIEGTVVEADEDRLILRLTKAVKGIPAGTQVTIRRTGPGCGHRWGAVDGIVYAIGAFQSFQLPNPVFEAVPLKPLHPSRRYREHYQAYPDYVPKREGKANRD